MAVAVTQAIFLLSSRLAQSGRNRPIKLREFGPDRGHPLTGSCTDVLVVCVVVEPGMRMMLFNGTPLRNDHWRQRSSFRMTDRYQEVLKHQALQQQAGYIVRELLLLLALLLPLLLLLVLLLLLILLRASQEQKEVVVHQSGPQPSERGVGVTELCE